ncbi:MAG: hypothetical protein EB059_02455 [Alphaproteobacteria bacterium]|nr:hypothetical protein [Alphaproteobacteria bacterium]
MSVATNIIYPDEALRDHPGSLLVVGYKAMHALKKGGPLSMDGPLILTATSITNTAFCFKKAKWEVVRKDGEAICTTDLMNDRVRNKGECIEILITDPKEVMAVQDKIHDYSGPEGVTMLSFVRMGVTPVPVLWKRTAESQCSIALRSATIIQGQPRTIGARLHGVSRPLALVTRTANLLSNLFG